MSLVGGTDAGEEGLVSLFEQVLLLAGSMWTILCLAPILNSINNNNGKEKERNL